MLRFANFKLLLLRIYFVKSVTTIFGTSDEIVRDSIVVIT